MIDTHCHLTKRFWEDPKPIIDAAIATGVEKLICVGTNLEDSAEAIKIANKFEGVYASVGIHPEETCNDWGLFEKLVTNKKVVAIGECGLDYKGGLPNQKEVFEKQIEISKRLNLPLIIHCREAQKEMEKILSAYGLQDDTLRGVLHCFAGGMEIPEGFYVSFAGNVTFKNAKELRETARNIPLEKLLVETDSPFLAPEPVRGSINEPKNVKIIAQYLADLKGLNINDIERITTENAKKLFRGL
ncbi:MAG: TatD family hydrolase [bacterium]|nr:TatD family hydrolase [bacterium]